ncbi:MAG: endonuclease/exonuclease/phosphatase family protein [Pseudomonadota bacterium]
MKARLIAGLSAAALAAGGLAWSLRDRLPAISGVPTAAQADDLRIATWNIEWLMTPATYDELWARCDPAGQPRSHERALPCVPGREPPPRRQAADLDALARIAESIEADVVALQEVDGPAAARLVFRRGWALDCFIRRAHPQKVGFAIRAGIPYRCNAELAELDLDGASRAGADVTLWPGTPRAVRILGVHLKSGCPEGPLIRHDGGGTREPCIKLSRQVSILARWAQAREREGVAYAIAGDFNRRLEQDARFDAGRDLQRPRNLLAGINAGLPPQSPMLPVTAGEPYTRCHGGDRHKAWIDNVLISSRLAARARARDFEAHRYDDRLARERQLSDHCPISVELDGAAR